MAHTRNLLKSLLIATVLSGCASMTPPPDTTDYRATLPLPEKPLSERHGSLFQESTSVVLFQDTKARRVGDIITVILTEQTNATKSASTSTDKSTDVSIQAPNIFGRTPALKPMGLGTTANPIDLSVGLGTEQGFDGSGDSTLSNALSGRVTVTVADVLTNGYLVVRGKKRVTINQGHEYVKISGIIRPQDILPDNTVLSTYVADAQISYTGDGSVHDATKPGAFARLLNRFWPF